MGGGHQNGVVVNGECDGNGRRERGYGAGEGEVSGVCAPGMKLG